MTNDPVLIAYTVKDRPDRKAIWTRIGLEGSPRDQRLPEAAEWGGYPGGLTVAAGDPLFPRIKA